MMTMTNRDAERPDAPSTDAVTGVETAEDRAERMRNNVKKLREQRLLSKAELARKSGLSALTIDRVEAGMPCRMDTKRKIILALGMTIEEKDKVFVPNEEEGNEDGQ